MWIKVNVLLKLFTIRLAAFICVAEIQTHSVKLKHKPVFVRSGLGYRFKEQRGMHLALNVGPAQKGDASVWTRPRPQDSYG